jgi:hypothetical protein
VTIPLTLTSNKTPNKDRGDRSKVTPGLHRGTSFTVAQVGSTAIHQPHRAVRVHLLRGTMTCESSTEPQSLCRLLADSTNLHARELLESAAQCVTTKATSEALLPRVQCQPCWTLASRNRGLQNDLPITVTVALRCSLLGYPGMSLSNRHRRSDLRVPSSLHRVDVVRQPGPIRAIFLHPLICDVSNDRAYGIWMSAVRDQARCRRWWNPSNPGSLEASDS